ncbi:hypothetical protein MSKU15_0221 [Komagataeibacter diospyri]|nr:hypothetical protein MSKU15_0221 [Komagataeibacter diospyri]
MILLTLPPFGCLCCPEDFMQNNLLNKNNKIFWGAASVPERRRSLKLLEKASPKISFNFKVMS